MRRLLLILAIVAVAPTASALNRGVGQAWARRSWIPRDQPGVVHWLPPEKITQSGGVITAWPDQSGQGNDATPVSSPPYSAAVLDGYGAFLGTSTTGGRFTLPNVFTGFTSAELFVVLKVGAGSLTNGLHNFGGQGELYPYVDGSIYEDFGTTVRKSTGAPVLSITSQHRVFNVRSAAGAWTAFLDNTQQFTTATNTVGFATNPQLGKADGGNSFIGSIVEVTVESRVSVAADKAAMLSYLKRKFPSLGL